MTVVLLEKIVDSSTSFNTVRDKVEAELTPYGQYLILKDVPTSVQPFALTDIGLIALFVIGWAVREYAKAFIQARAQKAANKDLKEKLDKLVQAQSETQWKLNDVEAEAKRLKELVSQLTEISKTSEIHVAHRIIEPEHLLKLLTELGLTQRAAQRCASNLLSILNEDIQKLLRE